MKAVVYEKYGTPDVLELREIEKPIPKADELLIKIHATTVTAGDWRMRKPEPVLARLYNGLLRPNKIKILGFEVAGVVDAIGAEVTEFKVGDEVFAPCGIAFGGYAEYKAVRESSAIHKPENVSFEEAAAVPVGGMTADYFLRAADVKPGDKVLIYGASGSVGTFAVQLAKEMGADVTGLCSTKNVDLVRSLGADRVIDYKKEDFTADGVKYDVIMDTVGKSDYRAVIGSLKDDGTFLRVSAIHPLAGLRAAWTNRTTSKKVVGGGGTSRESLQYLRDLMAAGKLKSVIDRRYTLETIREAHAYVQQGHKVGNVIVNIAT